MRTLLPRRSAGWVVGAGIAAALVGCSPSVPPTITPMPMDATPAGAQSVEIPINPPPGATIPVGPMEVPPARIDELVQYVDAGGRFSMDVPAGWTESRQPAAEPGSYVVLGTVFQPPESNALITITQFDSGQRPSSVGTTANEVLGLSGVMDQPGYIELGREKVIERPDEALRVEMAYTRSDGVDMHSLVLFQIDGTTFSMVHVGVEKDSWADSEGVLREMLSTYRVPAVRGG